MCVKGESNPQLNLGRVPCYHYTINAVTYGRNYPDKNPDTKNPPVLPRKKSVNFPEVPCFCEKSFSFFSKCKM